MTRESRLSAASAGVGEAYSQIRRVPRGELHPYCRCAFCGTSAAALHWTTVRFTLAPGLVCDDIVACARRREVADRAA
jgi:hypothetical protein